MGKTQKHQSEGAANLDSQQDSTADCAEGDYVTLATVRELLKVRESTFKWLFESDSTGQCGEGCSGDED